MKINHRFTLLALAAITLGTLAFSAFRNHQQKNRLKDQTEIITDLQKKLEVQDLLLKADSLLVRGQYENALTQYENQEETIIEDGKLGIGLRVAIAKKFLEFEENRLQQSAVINALNDSTSLGEIKPSEPKTNQLDSLRFVLSKTKMQLTKVRQQLHKKSFGEYLTFTNSKGSQVHYVGKVKNGKANGHGVAILNTGSRYVGEWVENKRHGQGTFYWKDGEYYEGEYKEDKRSGQGTYHWPNGEKYVGQWKDDRRSGKGAFFDKDGKLMTKGVWEDDKMITDTTKPKKRNKEKGVAAL